MGEDAEIQDAGKEIKRNMNGFVAGLLVIAILVGIMMFISYAGKRYGQKLVYKGIITVEEFYEVGHMGWFFIMIFGI